MSRLHHFASDLWSRRSKSRQRRTSDERRRLRLFETLEARVVMTAVAWYPLDETSGVVATDATGNGNHGTVTGGAWGDGQLDGAIEFNVDGNISVPVSTFDTIGQEVTFAFWAYGGDTQPTNDSILYGVNSSGGRAFNVHLPFSNGAVYWDAGNDAGYDRINKVADPLVYKDSWHHWAFTKNATTGTMTIYLDGQSWASATGKTKAMAGITAFTFGANTNGSEGYDGRLDDVRIYDTELTAVDVLDLYTNTTSPNTEEVLATNNTLAASENATTVITSADLQSTDAEQSAAELTYTVTSLPGSGTLLRGGTALGIYDTFTQADIDNNLVSYDHNGSSIVDSFSFAVNDGFGSVTSDSFTILLPNDGTVSSLAELRVFAGLSNVTVTMAPGVYWIDGDRPDATYLNFSGANSTFNLGQAEFRIDTRNIAGYRDESGATASFDVMRISGDNVIVNGLKLYGQDVDLDTDPGARRYPNRSATYFNITGSNVELNNAHIITAGSNPYGYGDAFGKGAPPSCRDLPAGDGGCAYIGHNKTSGVLLNGWGSNAKIDGLDLDMFTFGHGVFVQGYDDIEIRNTTVTGQMFSSNDVINHPVYQEYGFTAWGSQMHADILISGSEDGIRYYGDGDSLPWSEGLVLENVVVTNMREAFSLIAARGVVTVDNASAFGSEVGFEPGQGTVITNSRGDTTNGPLLFYRRDYVNDTNVELELVGNVPQVGRTKDIAYINGTNNVVTLTSNIDPGLLPADAYVRVGQRFNEWRKNPGDVDDTSLPADGVTVNNLTGQITVLGTNGDDVGGFSSAGTINRGDGNHYDGFTLVLSGTRMTAKDSQAMGNNGSLAVGTLASNGSIVFDGATLELNPGVRISNEMLTITGDGVDGKGALYTDGQAGSGTRFGSSNGSDESTIVLDGDASIGVGVAGNQMLVGSIQGAGNLTKLGPGTLSMEKSSTLDGDLIVAEGGVVARNGVVNRDLTLMAGTSIKAIGNMLNTPTGVIHNDGTLDLNGRTGENITSGTIGTLMGTGQITSSNTTAGAGSTLNIAGESGAGNYSGSIDGYVSLVKSGQSLQTLGGNLTHTGTTTVAGGTLRIDGTHTGGGVYTVDSSATLGGTGSIGSAVTVNSGGH
ncbi:cadherin-like domain-containing protein, partial [Rubripirellula tenax]|uniref:cadherin-like domain-containing protein n=1 Tax=Rubripirellula tenax TaxID=2528015 RepID=UPI0011B6864F